MIHIPSPIPEPIDFDAQCRRPGQAWLNTHTTGRPQDYWSPFRDALADGFAWRCGYKAMLNQEGTVDHFVSCDADRNQAYEWNNYRYVSQGINSSKRACPDYLDPFEVQDCWFRLLIPSLQLVATNAIPPGLQQRVHDTITKFKLVNGRNVITRRKFWYNLVADNRIPVAELHTFAPLVARAIEEWIAQYGPPLPRLP